MDAVIAHNGQPMLIARTKPRIGADELLVRVHAAGINRADLLQVAGNYPPPVGASDILGLELAGEVVAVGNDVTGFAVGDSVMSLVSSGAYAEYAAVTAAHTLRVPEGMTMTEAGAFMEAFLTAYTNMVEMGRLAAGEVVLIHAGASGVGLAAIQIAKAIGATVIVTASAAKHEVCTAHGADLCIDYKTESFVEVIGAQYPEGVDLVVEMVGAPYWDDNTRVLKRWGRLVFIGLLGGRKHEVDFGVIMAKRLTVMGSTLRNREGWRKTALVTAFREFAAPHLLAGGLRATVWSTFPIESVAEAHQQMKDNVNAGKIVLTMT